MAESSPIVAHDAPSSRLPDPGLRRATAQDVYYLKAVLAKSFFENPVLGWLIPDDTKRLARLRRFFAIELRHVALARGEVWTTSDLSGAALSLPPGAWRVPLHATLLEGTVFGLYLSRAGRLAATMEYRHVRERHYYIRDIGVHPNMQGKGLGSALMRPTLDRCDSEGLPAYLEASSERNARLYERLGFKLTTNCVLAAAHPFDSCSDNQAYRLAAHEATYIALTVTTRRSR